jgi:hypothetical protein
MKSGNAGPGVIAITQGTVARCCCCSSTIVRTFAGTHAGGVFLLLYRNSPARVFFRILLTRGVARARDALPEQPARVFFRILLTRGLARARHALRFSLADVVVVVVKVVVVLVVVVVVVWTCARVQVYTSYATTNSHVFNSAGGSCSTCSASHQASSGCSTTRRGGGAHSRRAHCCSCCCCCCRRRGYKQGCRSGGWGVAASWSACSAASRSPHHAQG